MLRFQTYYFN